MADPIAAGSVVVAAATLIGFELVTSRPLLGVCESATPPGAPGDPPTTVVVAWEDGTRVTYPIAAGLLSLGAPTSASLLGTVMQFALTNPPFLQAGTRLRGPVVLHANYFEPNGDPISGGENEVATVKTKFGYFGFPVTGLVAVPGA